MTKIYELPNDKTITADVDETHHMATVSVFALDNLVETVNEAAVDKWIPVSERLPENRKEVLVTDDTDIFTGWYEEDKWCSCYEEFWPYSDPIIAWMPLPKPYEPQERSDKE